MGKIADPWLNRPVGLATFIMHPLRKTKQGWNLEVHVQPRAKRTEAIGIYGQAVKIRVASPPVDGKANEALIEFFSKALRIAKGEIHLVAGATGRKKVISLPELPADEICRILGIEPPIDRPPLTD
ncbi:MAG: DUF167 domain-containing protein [Verrucomicrobiota bacterium]|nr:DUF167 domain-containing protein [Verrucomicrobiota bacterium]MDD8052072.1 DUF167 domain-containing protein [Verrucomicrobiota bacterium]